MSTGSSHETRRGVFIIGGGVMGLSTAWHLLNDKQYDVTICDARDHMAPSQDVSKILRIDYPDSVRMKEVMKSKSLWENDPVYKSHYKRTGRVVTYSKAHVETLLGIDHARSQLGLPPRIRQGVQFPQELYHSTQVASNVTVVYNEDDGVVDWTGAMKSVKEDCVRKGGRFRGDRVIRMQFNRNGKVESVVTSTESINTENTDVILAAGPWTMQLLEASSIQQPPLSRAPIATGIFSFSIELNVEQWKRYSNLPIKSDIDVGEFLCHPKTVGSAKLTWIKPFRNPSGEQAISTPWDASETNLAISRGVVRASNQCNHGGKHKHCVIAGGGSYTHAKDLPDIGQIVVEVLNGTRNHSQFGWGESSSDRCLANQPALRTDLIFDDLEFEASQDERVQRWKETTPDWNI